ncbi:hypothetical protein CJF42_00840 [Pseudoalteromonas sp. NBT06-2]|uniref:tetratricopeptide repeat protein n=1 Tax=Pseudoalteromonas sp. NBT06-2 TaxID=2025950 RepID=UPI000BA6ADC1|nr:tetratricopeptide repeat protein [Pseudoalteromonas sp. NBT06-2]PAJ76269.1 hypothetical protein CJF42_00840 [Pseudoalteromonas sp. NBT06-2]
MKSVMLANHIIKYPVTVLKVVIPFLLSISPYVIAHNDLTHRIHSLNHQLNQHPHNQHNIHLLVQSGKLKYKNKQYHAALHDLQQVLQLETEHSDALYYAAQANFHLNNYQSAEQQILRFYQQAKNPAGKIKANRLLGDIHLAEHAISEAVSFYQTALNLQQQPQPNDFLHAAITAQKLPDQGQQLALTILHQGINTLGTISSLADPAIKLHLALQQYNHAIQLTDTLLKNAAGLRKALLLEKKMVIYQQLQQTSQVKHTILLALAAIKSLSHHKQQSRQVQALVARLTSSYF